VKPTLIRIIYALQFFWLRPSRSDTQILDYEREQDGEIICDSRHHDQKYARIIQSGDLVHLHSRDIIRYPLPDRGLLELQRHLNRALCTVANADFLRLIFQDDEDSPKIPASSDMDEVDEMDKMGEWARLGYSPYFSQYLIDCALENGLIHNGDIPLWRERLIPLYDDTTTRSSSPEGNSAISSPLPFEEPL